MASRYIQKYPIPQDFPAILKNFSREILRDQPSNIIEYSAKYFEALERGESFTYNSAFNVTRQDRQYQLSFDGRQAEDLMKHDVRINHISGALSKRETDKISQVVDQMFERYDKNKNGLLESSELRTMVKEMYREGNIDMVPSEADFIFFVAEIDKNYDGKADKSEMCKFVRKMLN